MDNGLDECTGRRKLKRQSQRRRVFFSAATVFVISLTSAVLIGLIADMTAELLKFVMQLLITVVLVASVTIVVQFANRRLNFESPQRKCRVETYTSNLARLSDLYQGVKRRRRILTLTDLPQSDCPTYSESMDDLRDPKQEAERIWATWKPRGPLDVDGVDVAAGTRAVTIQVLAPASRSSAVLVTAP